MQEALIKKVFMKADGDGHARPATHDPHRCCNVKALKRLRHEVGHNCYCERFHGIILFGLPMSCCILFINLWELLA